MFRIIKRQTTSEHERTREDLSAYLDGQLSQADRSRVDRHLEACSDCRAELRSLKQTVALLHALPAARLPRSFLLPVGETRAQRRAQTSWLGYGHLQVATAVASVLLVLVVSGDVLLRFQSSRPAALPAAGRAGAPQTMAEPTAGLALGAGAPTSAALQPPEAVPTAVPAPSIADAARSTEAVPLGSPPGPSIVGPGQPSEGYAESTASVQPAPAIALPGATDQSATAAISPEPPPTLQAKSVTDQTAAATPALPTADNTPVEPASVTTLTAIPAGAGALPAAEPERQGGSERSELPVSQPSGWRALAERLAPYLQWLERGLAGTLALLLGATLWYRRRAQ